MVVAVATATGPVATMGGMRWLAEAELDDLDPAHSDLLGMPGGVGWQPGQEEPFVAVATRFLEAGVSVAAICGATEALARRPARPPAPHVVRP